MSNLGALGQRGDPFNPQSSPTEDSVLLKVQTKVPQKM